MADNFQKSNASRLHSNAVACGGFVGLAVGIIVAAFAPIEKAVMVGVGVALLTWVLVSILLGIAGGLAERSDRDSNIRKDR